MAYINSLRLVDFRSYSGLDLSLQNGPIVIFGPNGAGKTNLLEAISLLSPGRGLRRAAMDSLARKDGETRAPAWGINAVLDSGERLSIGQVPEYPRRRTVRIDRKSATGSQLAKLLAVMWLTPAQDRLFTGPAGDRRKFLDRFALTHHPQHGMASIRYEKARSERNRLLSDGIQDAGWYDALEADLAAQGTDIVKTRIETTQRLQAEIDARDSVFPKSVLRLEGHIETLFEELQNFDEVEFAFREQLAATRRVDMRAGRTLIGPHKTELHVTHAEKSMPAAQCSTGEQKALLIGLTLAHARAQSHMQPILLLDEVAAHLDEIRRAALAEELLDLGTQIFMTGTDESLFSDFTGRAQVLHIQDGAVDSQTASKT